jgi:hypothetical protein
VNRRRITLNLAIGATHTLAILAGLAGALTLAILFAANIHGSDTQRAAWTAFGAVLGMAAADGLIADLLLSPIVLRLRARRIPRTTVEFRKAHGNPATWAPHDYEDYLDLPERTTDR